MELFLKKVPKSKFVEAGIGIVFSIIGCLILNFIFVNLPEFWAMMLIGKKSVFEAITYQDVMWFMFIIGIELVYVRVRDIKLLKSYSSKKYLPEDFEVIINDQLLTEIIKKSKDDADKRMGILPYMILQISLQYRTNNSISLSSDFLTKQLELFIHSIEIRYNKLKYLIWLIPSLGFMGTVYGIGLAVTQLGKGSLDDPDLLTRMAGSLGIAFNTTLLALILSVILQFLAQHFETEEEDIVNSYTKYVMDNLLNKIVEKTE